MVRQYLRLGLWQDKSRLGFNLNAIENWEENKNGVVKMQMKTNIDRIILWQFLSLTFREQVHWLEYIKLL